MLRVAICLQEADEAIEGLDLFDIKIVRWSSPAHIRHRKTDRLPDVVLFVPSVLTSPSFARLTRGWNRSVAVVVLTDQPSQTFPDGYGFSKLLQSGVDAVVPKSCGPAGIAAALWSTHHQKSRVRALETELGTLRVRVKERKTIDQAKSIIAKQMGISEAQSLRRLRHQARNQRCSMYELSKSLIEAHRLLSPSSAD